MSNVLILGAGSGIGRALSHVLAADGHNLILAGRDIEELRRTAGDLALRHAAQARAVAFDALDFDRHASFFARCCEEFASLDGVILCYGYLVDQKLAEQNMIEARRTIDVNFTSSVSLLGLAADYFESRRQGFIAAISSVAGDRGRQSNYIYGAAKAGLSAFLAGLRNRLHRAGVHVLTVKPGFVDTPMTQGRVKRTSPLLASSEAVARDIARAIRRRRDVIYTPWFWRTIMSVIRLIPEAAFKRLSL